MRRSARGLSLSPGRRSNLIARLGLIASPLSAAQSGGACRTRGKGPLSSARTRVTFLVRSSTFSSPPRPSPACRPRARTVRTGVRHSHEQHARRQRTQQAHLHQRAPQPRRRDLLLVCLRPPAASQYLDCSPVCAATASTPPCPGAAAIPSTPTAVPGQPRHSVQSPRRELGFFKRRTGSKAHGTRGCPTLPVPARPPTATPRLCRPLCATRSPNRGGASLQHGSPNMAIFSRSPQCILRTPDDVACPF